MKNIRLGIIGCGNWAGMGHIKGFSNISSVNIVALADPSAESITRMKSKFPTLQPVREFSSHMDMLDTITPDAVLIATPHTLHGQHILDSFEAGCHVMVEKPFVSTIEESSMVIEARDQTRKTLLVAYQRHVVPEYRYITDSIRNGELGAIEFIAGLQSQGWLKHTVGTWRQDPTLSGGGQLADSGGHLIEFIIHGSGLRIKSVQAVQSNLGSPVNINSSIALEFDNGALGSISVIGNAPHAMWEDVSFYGSKGRLLLRTTPTDTKPMQSNLIHDNLDGTNREVTLPPAATPQQNFIDAILGVDDVKGTAELASHMLEVLLASQESSVTGQKIFID